MRIDAYNKINQVYAAASTKKTKAVNSTSQSDRVEISQIGKDYQISKQAVQSAPDVRMDKVDSIKSSIASGTYNVSANEVADHMVEHFFSETV